jgi:hypothetical protein
LRRSKGDRGNGNSRCGYGEDVKWQYEQRIDLVKGRKSTWCDRADDFNQRRKSGADYEEADDEASEMCARSSNVTGRETGSHLQVSYARARGASDWLDLAAADQCTDANGLVDCEEV